MTDDIYKFSFEDFRLLSVHFDLKTEEEKFEIKKNVEVSTNLTIKHSYFTREKKLRLIMTIDICGKDLPFSISVKGGSLYHFPKPVKDKLTLDKIAQINCAAIAYPYLREIVADIVRRSGLPQLNLPPVNFLGVYEKTLAEKA